MANAKFLLVSLVSLLSFISICRVDASRRLADINKQFGYTAGAPNEPTKWGSLRADWKTCEMGKSQSPINLDEMQTQIQPADLKVNYKDAPAKVVNEGFDINIEWQGDAGGIEINGVTYNLVHSHWHVPSEHTIDGNKFDAELHLVHSNAKEELAIMACFYTIGEPDPLLQSLADKIKTLGSSKVVEAGTISASNVKCSGSKYFRYMGSLTTPPCQENVIWTIAQKAKTISQEQIQMLKGPVERDCQENARPVQELEGRPVFSFAIPEEE